MELNHKEMITFLCVFLPAGLFLWTAAISAIVWFVKKYVIKKGK